MENIKDLNAGPEENAKAPEEAQKHLGTDSTSLSLDDLDAVAGGRGRKNTSRDGI